MIRCLCDRIGVYKPLALRMEVEAIHCSLHLIETDIIKPLEASARDCSDTVVRDEKILLPAHKHVLTLGEVTIAEISPLCLSGERFPSRKSGPMMYISFLVDTPFLVASQEGVFGAYDLSFKKCGQSRMIFCQTCCGVKQDSG